MYKFWPTKEEPDNKYKFSSIQLQLTAEQTVIERSTYNGLEYLGDVGGLFDGLLMIGGAIIFPISNFAAKAKLLSSIFLLGPSQSWEH